MDSKSTGISIKSSGAVDLRPAQPKEDFPHVSAGPACCDVGPAGLSVTEKKTAGWEGPGVGSAKVLNSDNQMPGPTYGNG